MSSLLIITPVEKLQSNVNQVVSSFSGMSGVYVSLNKTQKGIEDILRKNDIDTSRLFFIDCVSAGDVKDDTLRVSPSNLDNLSYAINSFIKEIPGKKFLILDALSTLLIYNSENKVAGFVNEVTAYASREDVEVIAISPVTKGEELLNKIFNFFNEVKKDEGEVKEAITDGDEELIY